MALPPPPSLQDDLYTRHLARMLRVMTSIVVPQHNIILGAIEELIREHYDQLGDKAHHQPTPNEYFAALMTGLEAQDQSHTPEVRLMVVIMIGTT